MYIFINTVWNFYYTTGKHNCLFHYSVILTTAILNNIRVSNHLIRKSKMHLPSTLTNIADFFYYKTNRRAL
jgi:hypothetical protein